MVPKVFEPLKCFCISTEVLIEKLQAKVQGTSLFVFVSTFYTTPSNNLLSQILEEVQYIFVSTFYTTPSNNLHSEVLEEVQYI